MTEKATATASKRWDGPTFHESGNFWVATLRYPLSRRERAAGLEAIVFGPQEWACIAETQRQDRLWADYPLRRRDEQTRRARLRFLASGGADGDADSDSDGGAT